ncbi:MAG: hypothetical protein ABWY62_04155 [Acidimicrobiia bacterium]
MRRLIPFLAVGVVLLAGCRAEINVGMDVESTGAGTVAAEVGVDDELLTLIESSGGSIDDLVGEIPGGATALEPRQEGDLTVYGFTRAFASPDELNALLAEGIQGIEAEGTELELTVEDGGATLAGSIAIPDVTEQAGELGDIGGSLGEFVTASFRAHLPGKVVEHNADSILDDGTLVWELPLTGGTVDVQARSDSGSGFPVVPVVIGIALVAAGGAAIYLFTRRSKGEGAAAIAATPEPAEPTPVFGASEPATDGEDPVADSDRPDGAT